MKITFEGSAGNVLEEMKKFVDTNAVKPKAIPGDISDEERQNAAAVFRDSMGKWCLAEQQFVALDAALDWFAKARGLIP